MEKPLRVLLIDDSADDAKIVVRELKHGGYEPDYDLVDSADTVRAALDNSTWDLVLADYTMPGFSGLDALKELRGRGLDTPFIFVSGSIGEDVAVAAMKAGAQDYLIKGNLKRLVPAIDRELQEARTRADSVRAEAGRKRAEEKLRQLSQLVEQSVNLIMITDTNGVIDYVNPQFLTATGYKIEEVVGRTPTLLKSEQAPAPEWSKLWAAVLSGRNWRGEFANKRKDGSVMFVSASIFPLKDDSGSITHFVSIQEDVTHRKEIEEQLRRSQRMEALGQLTGGLAHDFNNLLTIVISNLDLLASESVPGSETRSAAEGALEASLRGAALIRQLLAFARRQPLEAKVFEANERVVGIMDLLRRTLGEQVKIEMKLAKDLWLTATDPAQVESAIVNLAINSRDAMPNGGRLTIETANKHLDQQYSSENPDVTPGDYVMLAVSDSGEGMPREVLNRVLEPFFTTKGQGKGTGLGLSMVYGFTKQSRGHLKIYSEVGHGTTVRLYLPRAAVDAAVHVVEQRPVEATRATREATILVVEDNVGVRSVALRQLRSLGYRVIETENAASALAVLRTSDPIDLLFTDVVMPGNMTGVQLAKEARTFRPELKVLMTSGFSEIPGSENGLSDGRMRFLGKPYRKHELAQRVRDLLESS